MLIRSLLSKGLPFVAFRLPAEKEPVWWVQQTLQAHSFPLETIDDRQGFVVAPFDACKTRQAFLITPDYTATGMQEKALLLRQIKAFPDKVLTLPHTSSFIIDKPQYIQQVQSLIARIKSGEAQKVVLSRVIEKPLDSGFDYDLFFHTLQHQYPHAFVYLFHLPGH
jgi:isochorismate synthase EntC